MRPKYRNLFIAAAALLTVSSAHAQSGTWIRTTGTFNWSDTGSWLDGIVADGPGNTADFTTGFTANTTVTLDSSRTIGHIIKDDTNGALNVFTIATSGTPASILTLATGGGAPTITNSDLGGAGRMDIAAQLTGTQGLTKLGVGNVHLNNNNNNWSGNTTISEGLLHLGGANLANIGGGTGRNISVAAGAAFGINSLDNAKLNRIVESAAEFSVLTNGGSAALDFSSSTGANLSGAFLGSNLTNGGKSEFSGIITMADNYRLGAVGGFQNGTLGIRQESLLSGTNGLIIGGNRVVIVGTHTFSGDTTIRDGGVLGLAGLNADAVGARNNSSALQNSVLDLGAPGATGRIFLEAATTAGPITGSTSLANGATTSATFGGLKGSRNLYAAFLFTAPGNNTSATTAVNVTGFTLNTGTGVTASYSGAIGGFGAGASAGTGGASTLTKTGEGTQILSGANTYTGATNINEGTLLINGSTSTGMVDVAANGTLGGDGTIGGATTVNGTLAVGAIGSTVGAMNFGSDLTVAGTYLFDLNSTSNTADLADVTGNLTLGGNLDLVQLGAFQTGDKFTLFAYDGTLSGAFTGLADDTVFTDAGGEWLINYNDTTAGLNGGTSVNNTFVTITAAAPIPEPSSAALLGALGMLALLRRRR